MKTLLTALCVFFSANALAAIDFSQGQPIDQFEIDGKQTKYSGAVSMRTPQIGESINVHVMAPIDCPENMACPAVMQEIFLDAEIVSITKQCGSIVYEAVTDGTPHDGPRTEIKVQDHSGRMCRDMRKGLIEIEAKVSVLRTQSERKYFAVQSWNYNSKNFVLSKGVRMNSVKLSGGEVAGSNGYVKVNESAKQVLVSYSYGECNGANSCGSVLKHKTLNLRLVSKKNDGCGSIVYKAQTREIMPGGQFQQFTITDNSQRICEDVFRARLTVDGTISFPYPQSTPITIEMLK